MEGGEAGKMAGRKSRRALKGRPRSVSEMRNLKEESRFQSGWLFGSPSLSPFFPSRNIWESSQHFPLDLQD